MSINTRVLILVLVLVFSLTNMVTVVHALDLSSIQNAAQTEAASPTYFSEPYTQMVSGQEGLVAAQPIMYQGKLRIVGLFDSPTFVGIKLFTTDLFPWKPIYTTTFPFMPNSVDGLVVTDYDNDNRQDFFVSSTQDNVVFVFRSAVLGGFSSTWLNSSAPEALSLYDRQTIVASVEGLAYLVMHHWNGTSWDPQTLVNASQGDYKSLLVTDTDFNGDSKPEIVRAVGTGSPPRIEYYGTSYFGGFTPVVVITVPSSYDGVDAVGVIQTNTGPQILVSTGGNAAEIWRINYSYGQFSIKQVLSANDNPVGLIEQLQHCGNSFVAVHHSGMPKISEFTVRADGTLVPYSLQDSTNTLFPNMNSTFYHPALGYVWVEKNVGMYAYQLAVCQPDVAVSVFLSETQVAVGSPFTVTVFVANKGSATATDLLFESPVISGVVPISITSEYGDCVVATMTCTVATLLPGDVAVVTMTVLPQSEGIYLQTVFAYASETESSLENNTADYFFEVVGPTAVSLQTVNGGSQPNVLFMIVIVVVLLCVTAVVLW